MFVAWRIYCERGTKLCSREWGVIEWLISPSNRGNYAGGACRAAMFLTIGHRSIHSRQCIDSRNLKDYEVYSSFALSLCILVFWHASCVADFFDSIWLLSVLLSVEFVPHLYIFLIYFKWCVHQAALGRFTQRTWFQLTNCPNTLPTISGTPPLFQNPLSCEYQCRTVLASH